jgi:hypothetical protein
MGQPVLINASWYKKRTDRVSRVRSVSHKRSSGLDLRLEHLDLFVPEIRLTKLSLSEVLPRVGLSDDDLSVSIKQVDVFRLEVEIHDLTDAHALEPT